MSLFIKRSFEHAHRTSRGPALARTLSAFDVVLLGVGAVVGSGIFVVTGTGALMAGPGLALSFVIAAFACALAALCYAEFSSSFPVAGSIYSYAYATLGEIVAWVMGWILMLEYGLATSAVAVSWSGYLQSLLAGFGIHLPVSLSAAPGTLDGVQTLFNLPAFAVVMLISWLLAIGVRQTARFNNLLVLLKVGIVILVIVTGSLHVRAENWRPFMPFGWSGVFSAAAVMFFAFIGFDAVSSAAEEVKNPKRDMPIGLIGSLAVCAVLYVGVATVLLGMIPYTAFEGVVSPVSMAFKLINQGWVAGLVDLAAVVGMLTVIMVMAYGQTRLIFAMGRDGLLPPAFARVHPRYSTPYIATWTVGLVFALIAGFCGLDWLVGLINFGTLSAFAVVSASVLVLRKTMPELPRGFTCPGAPLVPALSVFCCLFLMSQLPPHSWISFSVWIVLGLLFYFGYSRRHSVAAGFGASGTQS